MTRKDVVVALGGATILALSAWGLRFGAFTPWMRALWMIDALLGLVALAKATENLLAARLPPPPPRAVLEPPSLWEDEDDDEEETP